MQVVFGPVGVGVEEGGSFSDSLQKGVALVGLAWPLTAVGVGYDCGEV